MFFPHHIFQLFACVTVKCIRQPAILRFFKVGRNLSGWSHLALTQDFPGHASRDLLLRAFASRYGRDQNDLKGTGQHLVCTLSLHQRLFQFLSSGDVELNHSFEQSVFREKAVEWPRTTK